MKRLEVTTSRVDDVTVCKLCGSVDMADAGILRKQIDELFKKDCFNLIVDLTELAFMSSPGLESLIHTHTICQNHKGLLTLVNPQPAIQKVLEATRLNQFFEICGTLQEAVKTYRSE